MSATATRKTADERRAEIIEAAREEFARHGLDGASTDAIARTAGISQPYLFRLFGTKKELFLACMRQCLGEMLETFRTASAGLEGQPALHAIGEAYGDLLRNDPMRLQAQMQGYAAANDPQVREAIREGFGRLVEHAIAVSGKSDGEISSFFATGMLLNVLAMMGILDDSTPWGARLIEGCKHEAP